MPPAAREIRGYHYDHKTTAFTTDLNKLPMHAVLNPSVPSPVSNNLFYESQRYQKAKMSSVFQRFQGKA